VADPDLPSLTGWWIGISSFLLGLDVEASSGCCPVTHVREAVLVG